MLMKNCKKNIRNKMIYLSSYNLDLFKYNSIVDIIIFKSINKGRFRVDDY
jgi:hypothetical protein